MCPVAVMWWSQRRQNHIFRHVVWLMFALYITWIWESEAEWGDSGIIWKYWEYVYWVRYKASLSVHLLDKIILDYTIIGSSDGNPIWSQLSRPHHSCSVVDSLEMNSISYCKILCQYLQFLKNFFIKDSLWKYIFEIIKG